MNWGRRFKRTSICNSTGYIKAVQCSPTPTAMRDFTHPGAWGQNLATPNLFLKASAMVLSYFSGDGYCTPTSMPTTLGSSQAYQQGSVSTNWTTRQIKEAIDPALFRRSSAVALSYLARDVSTSFVLAYAVYSLDGLVHPPANAGLSTQIIMTSIRTFLWTVYWWFQSLNFTGIWVIGHECAHGAFSPSRRICDFFGFAIHTALGTPYQRWKHVHAIHHHQHALIDHLNIRQGPQHTTSELQEAVEGPAYLLCAFTIQHVRELFSIVKSTLYGQKVSSTLFDRKNRVDTLLSDVGFLAVASVMYQAASRLGAAPVAGIYVVPWFFLSFWLGALWLVQHSDEQIFARRKYRRGTLSTIDRDFLGWQGRYFLHNMAHCHIVHHLFPKLPFYNAPEATKQVQNLLGSDYLYSDTPILEALASILKHSEVMS
ncbi:hypothetical protein BV25DRAFT_347037 [Artomyces pyxidatus]|uniref:Uncharacterized protein n=1 Tax=Artomyces pyxidatus TaxID=48021 RepID=A0ACB8T7K9_9AGAM|nr:hypothetical protein BV25DRAFT_347037 [Artomyces pyxidatus]